MCASPLAFVVVTIVSTIRGILLLLAGGLQRGAFGRVLDPFVDKVLVLGSFIFFAGKNFTIPDYDPTSIPTNVRTITGRARQSSTIASDAMRERRMNPPPC
mgnify:CR=1 FL=1